MANETQHKPEVKTPLAAVNEAADASKGSELSSEVKSKATEWFLSSEAQEVASALVPVNVAPAGEPEDLVEFKVQVVDRDKIRDLRKEAERPQPNGTTEIDEMEANLKIVVEGMIDPDLKDPAMLTVRGQRFLDPADALKARFAHKPGLIDQLAGKIVQVSGYNDADVKEVKAAGNS